jgi:hypothetical protein
MGRACISVSLDADSHGWGGTVIINNQGVVVEIDNISGTFQFGGDTFPQVEAAI